ncbi:MAG: lysophospholipid acyltransferase family protein [Gemmatimonadota bacterium]
MRGTLRGMSLGLPTIPARDVRLLALQWWVSLLFFPFVAAVAIVWLRGVKRLSLRDAAGVRGRFRSLVGNARGPVLICCNHLTMIDSVVLNWAIAPMRWYLRHYDRLPWSVPEKTNFSRTLFWRVASFLGKSVYVTRGGPREEVKRTLGRIAHLLRSGELVCIFPEGGRSRSGRVDTEGFAYGAGQVVQSVPGTSVLCIYMRGRLQHGYTDLPVTDDEYELDFELFEPVTAAAGLRGARDIATQIIHRLAAMEERHLAARQ